MDTDYAVIVIGGGSPAEVDVDATFSEIDLAGLKALHGEIATARRVAGAAA